MPPNDPSVVTPEMIQAGLAALRQNFRDDSLLGDHAGLVRERIVCQIYLAMLAASPKV